jgi:hypothetical protein
MSPTPHDDLDPAAGDYTQKEGREKSHCDLRVKHFSLSLLKRLSCFSAPSSADHGMFSTIISQTSCPLPRSIALAL